MSVNDSSSGVMPPQYRFHGRTPPEPGKRTAVRASIAADSQDGVATMRLYDPIDSWGGDWGVSAKEFVSALDDAGEVNEIRLHLNSPGGEVFEGIAILNALRNHPAKVVAVVDGLAASAASFIATGADEVVMGRNSQLMIHDAWGICIGNAADMRGLAGRLDHLSNNIASVYAEKAGGTIEDWRGAMLAESWFSAEEAVAAGLADRVETGSPADDKAKAKFDLSVFQFAGRDEAPAPVIPKAATCACGPNGGPNLVAEAAHKDECPDAPSKDAAPTGPSALAVRRHRMNARRFGKRT